MNKCGSLVDDRFVDSFVKIDYLSREECALLHRNKFYSIPGNENIKVKISGDSANWFGDIIGSNENCNTGEFFHPMTLKFLDHVTVHLKVKIKLMNGDGSYELSSEKLIINNVEIDDYEDLELFDEKFGSVFWDEYTKMCDTNNDEGNFFVTFRGTVVREVHLNLLTNKTEIVYYVIDGNTNFNFFLVSSHTVVICNFEFQATQSDALFVLEESNLSENLRLQKLYQTDIRNFDAILLMSMKVDYVQRDVGIQMEKMYQNILIEKCISDFKVLQTAIHLSYANPIDFGLLLTAQTGIFAILKSDVIYLKKCSKVDVDLNLNEKGCFEELPVLLGDKKKFLSLRSKILLDVGKIVVCSHTTPNKYLIHDKFYEIVNERLIESTGIVDSALIPFQRWNYEYKNQINVSIYNKKDTKSYHQHLMNQMLLQTEMANDYLQYGRGRREFYENSDFQSAPKLNTKSNIKQFFDHTEFSPLNFVISFIEEIGLVMQIFLLIIALIIFFNIFSLMIKIIMGLTYCNRKRFVLPFFCCNEFILAKKIKEIDERSKKNMEMIEKISSDIPESCNV